MENARSLVGKGFAGFLLCAAGLLQASSAEAGRCVTVIIGRGASADGSVLLSHNEDLGDYAAQHYVSVPRKSHAADEVITLYGGATLPQVPVTYGYAATTIFDMSYVPGDLTTGINEYQVSIANNLAHTRDAADVPIAGRIIWTEFTRLVLERTRSAREAVQLMGELAQKYKLGSDPGTMFGVTDPREGWFMEITQEGQWVAERVPDSGVALRTNTFRIGDVALDDPGRFLYSDDLVSYAIAKGFYTPGSGPFNFTKIYADPMHVTASWNVRRQEQAERRLAASAPQLRVRDLFSLMRDHYEGTAYDPSPGYSSGSPHRTDDDYTICNMTTEVSVVCQSRGWLPAEIGAVCWRAMTAPCSSTFTPWYLVQTDIPDAFTVGTNEMSSRSAYWTYRLLSERVDASYHDTIRTVRGTWERFELQELIHQHAVEQVAATLYSTDKGQALRVLGDYANQQARLALGVANGMLTRPLNTD